MNIVGSQPWTGCCWDLLFLLTSSRVNPNSAYPSSSEYEMLGSPAPWSRAKMKHDPAGFSPVWGASKDIEVHDTVDNVALIPLQAW